MTTTAVFIPSRTSSARRPGKALLEIGGKPVIEHLIDRVKTAKLPDFIVLCTTENLEDDVLVEIACRNGIRCFRGSEHDIPDRYLGAVLENGVDLVVEASGDNILCDPKYMDMVATLLRQTGADYIRCEGLPFGAAPVGIKGAALKRLNQLKEGADADTGWPRYFTESELFKVETLPAAAALRHPEIRMSLDYPEDLEFFRTVFEKLYVPGKVFSLKETLSLLRDNPEIVAINQFRQAEYWETFNQKQCQVRLKRPANESSRKKD